MRSKRRITSLLVSGIIPIPMVMATAPSLLERGHGSRKWVDGSRKVFIMHFGTIFDWIE